LTCFPSTTALALVLGADSPCADARGAGNLGLTATRTFTWFIATHVSIRTSDTSSSPYEPPSPAYGTLSYHPDVRFQLAVVSKSVLVNAPTQPLQHLGDLRTHRAKLAIAARTHSPSRDRNEATLISSAEPTAIDRNRCSSAFDLLDLPKPSAMLAQIPFCCSAGSDRLARLFDCWKCQARTMDIERHPIRTLEDFQFLEFDERHDDVVLLSTVN
jgi:hypothetical protein